MDENKTSSISQATSLREIGVFWDEHDFTEFDAGGPDILFRVSSAIAIEPDLLTGLETQAEVRGIAVETLVNLWLQEKLAEHQLREAA